MTEKTGIVYSIAETNEPPSRSVIENTVYENYGYKIRHYSIAENMTIVPERYTHHTLYFVSQGTLHIEYKADDERMEKILGEGMSIIRPADQLWGFSSSQDCVFSELILPSTSNISSLLEEDVIFRLSDMISFRQHDSYELKLIDDTDLQFALLSLDEDTESVLDNNMTFLFVTVLYGEGDLSEKGNTYRMGRHESYCTKEKEISVSSEKRTKMMALYCR